MESCESDMTCNEAESLLLIQHGADPAPDGDLAGQLAAHVATCAACGETARKLRTLESAVRSLPVPAESSEARLRFEALLHSQTAVTPKRSIAGRIVRSRWAAAAA